MTEENKREVALVPSVATKISSLMEVQSQVSMQISAILETVIATLGLEGQWGFPTDENGRRDFTRLIRYDESEE